jgi:hypothetical protein
MTKLRPPVSIENTLYFVLGELTIERAAAVTTRSIGYLRALSDPDKRERLTVEDAIKLDLAYIAAGGSGRPFHETMGLLVEAASATRFSDAAAIGRHEVEVARENGEACAALFEASVDPTDIGTLERALRESEDSHRAAGAAIATIRDQLARARDGPPPAPT